MAFLNFNAPNLGAHLAARDKRGKVDPRYWGGPYVPRRRTQTKRYSYNESRAPLGTNKACSHSKRRREPLDDSFVIASPSKIHRRYDQYQSPATQHFNRNNFRATGAEPNIAHAPWSKSKKPYDHSKVEFKDILKELKRLNINHPHNTAHLIVKLLSYEEKLKYSVDEYALKKINDDISHLCNRVYPSLLVLQRITPSKLKETVKIIFDKCEKIIKQHQSYRYNSDVISGFAAQKSTLMHYHRNDSVIYKLKERVMHDAGSILKQADELEEEVRQKYEEEVRQKSLTVQHRGTKRRDSSVLEDTRKQIELAQENIERVNHQLFSSQKKLNIDKARGNSYSSYEKNNTQFLIDTYVEQFQLYDQTIKTVQELISSIENKYNLISRGISKIEIEVENQKKLLESLYSKLALITIVNNSQLQSDLEEKETQLLHLKQIRGRVTVRHQCSSLGNPIYNNAAQDNKKREAGLIKEIETLKAQMKSAQQKEFNRQYLKSQIDQSKEKLSELETQLMSYKNSEIYLNGQKALKYLNNRQVKITPHYTSNEESEERTYFSAKQKLDSGHELTPEETILLRSLGGKNGMPHNKLSSMDMQTLKETGIEGGLTGNGLPRYSVNAAGVVNTHKLDSKRYGSNSGVMGAHAHGTLANHAATCYSKPVSTRQALAIKRDMTTSSAPNLGYAETPSHVTPLRSGSKPFQEISPNDVSKFPG